jgi:signal peptidase I
MTNARNELFEWGKAFIIAFIIVFIIRTFILTPIVVDGASMMPTLKNQERMIVSKIKEPKRFAIVVFQANEEKAYIKRVIGLPGDHIEYRNDKLYINNQAYEEPYLDAYKESHERSQIGGPYTADFAVDVPEGTLFVMGDNRRNSKDSRHIGSIAKEKLIGSTKTVYWPVKEMRVVNN